MRKIVVGLVAVAAFMTVSAKAASAETIVFNVCNVASLCGHLQLSTSLGAGNSVNVTLSEVGGEYGLFGDSGANHAFAFNVIGGAGVPAGFSVTNESPGAFSDAAGPGNEGGGFGSYEWFVNGSVNGGGASILPVSFTLNKTGGFASANIADVFEKNADGYYFAAHLAGPLDSPTGGCTPGTSAAACNTGFVAYGGTSQTTVPEPASMLLLGTGLLAAFRARRS